MLTYEGIKNKAYSIVNLILKKERINNINPEFKQFYDSRKFNLPDSNEIYDIGIRRKKFQRGPDHSKSYGRWQGHLRSMNLRTLKKTYSIVY